MIHDHCQSPTNSLISLNLCTLFCYLALLHQLVQDSASCGELLPACPDPSPVTRHQGASHVSKMGFA